MKSKNNSQNISTANVIEQNEIRLLIWGLLNIYPELSFTELAQKLGKSKSTLFPHIQELIDAGLMQISKEKKVRGSIPAKYYSIVPDALEKIVFTAIDTSGGINEEVSQQLINAGKSKINYSKMILEMGVKFWKAVEDLDLLKFLKTCLQSKTQIK
jgi:predicted transcriptional regulator